MGPRLASFFFFAGPAICTAVAVLRLPRFQRSSSSVSSTANAATAAEAKSALASYGGLSATLGCLGLRIGERAKKVLEFV